MQGPHTRLRLLGSRVSQHLRVSEVRASSDEGDADGDGGGLAPLRRLLGDEVLHHCVFGHVLHKVGLLNREKPGKKVDFRWWEINRKENVTSGVNTWCVGKTNNSF